MLFSAHHVPERLCSGSVYLGCYNKCSIFTFTFVLVLVLILVVRVLKGTVLVLEVTVLVLVLMLRGTVLDKCIMRCFIFSTELRRHFSFHQFLPVSRV